MRLHAVFALLSLSAAAFGQEPLLPGQVVASLAKSRDGVWAATDRGLFLIEAYSIRRVGPERRVSSVVGTAGGEAVYARYGERTARASRNGFEWTDKAVHWPLLLGVEHRGEVWKPSPTGIWRTRKRFTRYELPNADRVHALAAARDGSIWCATQKGVARFKDGRFEVMQEQLGLVTAVAVDREQNVWIGSGSAFTGVYRLDEQGWKRIEGIDAFVHSIALDPAGTLWFAALNAPDEPETAGHGAWYWADGAFRRAGWLGSKRVYDVAARDPSGVLWFATLKGLVAYEGEGKLTHYTPESGELSAPKVWCLSAARDGSLWIGYQRDRGGASRLARGAVTHFTSGDGLCSDEVWAVAEGRRGVFWFATNKGLARYDGRRFSCFRFTQAGLWPILPRPDGSLWIGSLGDGLWHFVPDDREAPRTTIEHDGGTISWQGADAWFDTPSQDLWYRWRLDGGRWSKARPVRSTPLDLMPGKHVFEVQAIDRFGNAEDPPARIQLEVDGSLDAPWLWIAAGLVLLIALLWMRRGS